MTGREPKAEQPYYRDAVLVEHEWPYSGGSPVGDRSHVCGCPLPALLGRPHPALSVREHVGFMSTPQASTWRLEEGRDLASTDAPGGRVDEGLIDRDRLSDGIGLTSTRDDLPQHLPVSAMQGWRHP
jgi:hypothetical protein